MNFQEILLPIIQTVLTGLACWAVSAFISWLKSKTKSDKLKNALTAAEELVNKTVKETTQTYVDELKKAGTFDLEAQKEAFKITYNKIKEQLTDEMRAALETQCSDIDCYIKTLIESSIKEA